MQHKRYAVSAIQEFASAVFSKLGVPRETADLALLSLLDASLMGIDTHGIEALDMYVAHIEAGGLKSEAELMRVSGPDTSELWDMQHGFGLAGARTLMSRAISKVARHGICLLVCRNTNHIGACGIYGKMAADVGLVAMVSQQSNAAFAPWGASEPRMGTSPFAFAAPVKDAFPFYFDASLAAISRGKIKAHRRSGEPLPEGVALDAEGRPTTDPDKAWFGQLLPIGAHKGAGLAMVLEILSSVLAANRFSTDIPSIVNHPELSAGSSLFMLVIDPQCVMPGGDFAVRMRDYVDYIESSNPKSADDPARYPGRREGENWRDRSQNGIPICGEALERFRKIAHDLKLPDLL